MVNDTDKFTPEDAAVLLKKEPFANVEIRLDKAAEQVFKPEAPDHRLGDGLDLGNPLIREKHQFWVTDISDVKNKRMYVRDQEGIVREATRAERWWKRNNKPEYRHQK